MTVSGGDENPHNHEGRVSPLTGCEKMNVPHRLGLAPVATGKGITGRGARGNRATRGGATANRASMPHKEV